MPEESGQTKTCAHAHLGGRDMFSQRVVDLMGNQTFQSPLTPGNEGGEEDIETGLGGLEDITAEELEAPAAKLHDTERGRTAIHEGGTDGSQSG